jgi:hypothetical protein
MIQRRYGNHLDTRFEETSRRREYRAGGKQGSWEKMLRRRQAKADLILEGRIYSTWDSTEFIYYVSLGVDWLKL